MFHSNCICSSKLKGIVLVFVCLSVCLSRFSVYLSYSGIYSNSVQLIGSNTQRSQHRFRPFCSRAGTVICFVCVTVCSWSGWEWKPSALAFVQKQWQCFGGNPACRQLLSNHRCLPVSRHEQVHWNGNAYCSHNSVSYITLPQVRISVCTRGNAMGMDVIGHFSKKLMKFFWILNPPPPKLLSHQLLLSSW